LALTREVVLFADRHYIPESSRVFGAGIFYVGLNWTYYEADLL